MEFYEILPGLTKQAADERKLPTGTGPKEVSVNLVTRLEKYFDVLYANCGEEDPAYAGEKIRDFHMGSYAPWCAFSNGEVESLIRDEDFERWIQKIRTILGKLAEINTSKVFYLVHKPGIGGSTMLRYIGWKLHFDYPVLMARKYEKLRIKNLLEDLYDMHSAKGILVLADEEFDNVEDLERDIKELSRPCAMVSSKRTVGKNCFSKQDFPFTLITKQAEKRLQNMFRKISPLEPQILKEKDKAYDDFIHQDASMKSPFFIGLYYT